MLIKETTINISAGFSTIFSKYLFVNYQSPKTKVSLNGD